MKNVVGFILMICMAAAANGQTESRGGGDRSLGVRPPIRRDSGRVLSVERKDPISVTSAASGYPEIAPGSGVRILAPIRRNASAQDPMNPPTSLAGVSVRIDGIACRIYQVWNEGVLVIAPSSGLTVERTVDVVVSTPDGHFRGKVKARHVAPGVYHGSRDGVDQWWPLGLYQLKSGETPKIISDQPISPSRGANKTIVKVIATGLRQAEWVQVFVDGRPVPLIGVSPGILFEQDDVTFELPDWLWGGDRLVKVSIVAGFARSNPFWLRLPSASTAAPQ